MFNQNLRLIREKRCISQTQMAKLLDIPVSTYRNYENTSRQPDFEVLVRISKILSVSTDTLLNNTSVEGVYSNLISKIKNLPESNLEELERFIDFLIYSNERGE